MDAAIRSSGKRGWQIARALGVNATTISRIRTGKEDNPKLKLLMGIAHETGTPLAVILGVSPTISPEDKHELQRFRDWIDRTLCDVDALLEPNAEIVAPKRAGTRERQVADRSEPIKTPFGTDTHLVLRATGRSMIGDGILPDDTLYVAEQEGGNATPVGKLIACRIGRGVFVKRLISDGKRLRLASAHPRYRPIELEGLTINILGVVIGRVGRIK